MLCLAAALLLAATCALAAPEGDQDVTAWLAERLFRSPAAATGVSVPGASLAAGPLLSFVYGGRASSELLPTWEAAEHTEQVSAQVQRRTVTLTDPQTGLQVQIVADVYVDTGGVDWVCAFTNTGAQDTPILEQIQAVDASIAPTAAGVPLLRQIHGSTSVAEDWLPFDTPLSPGQKVEFGPHGQQANSSSGACPFFTVQWLGGGVVTAIGWSVPWRACIERTETGALRLQAGMARSHLYLKPGESIRGPRILQLYWPGDDPWVGYNQFRQVMLQHIMPRCHGELVLPPVAFAAGRFSEPELLEDLGRLDGLGFEAFWVDAWWHRGRYPEGAGNYGFPVDRLEDHERFPRGLRPVGDAVHSRGMEFVVWFSADSPWRNSALHLEHPEWVRCWEDNKPLIDWCQLDLTIPAAREYITQYLIEAIRTYGIDWLRIDAGMITEFAEERDRQDPDRAGLTAIRYTEALYRMWDEIRAAYPDLAIDNCYGGGRRIDLDTCARSTPLWRTDAVSNPVVQGQAELAAILNQSMSAGLNRYLPFSQGGQVGFSPYLFRSGFNGGITWAEGLSATAKVTPDLAAATAEAKRLRPYLLGNYYALTPVTVSPANWLVLQYHRPDKQDGIVLAYRREQSSRATLQVDLKEIAPGARYQVIRASGFEPSPVSMVTGQELARPDLEIREQPGSLLIEYQRLAD